MTNELKSVLDNTYDLSYRPASGDTSYYCLDILYSTLGEGGKVQSVANWRGGFRRTVDGIDADGAVQETIVWQRSGRRERDAGSPFGDEWEPLGFFEGFTYPFSAEDDYPDFQPDYSGFPSDEAGWPLGWNALLMTVDAHVEFDYLRSRRHGAIDKLRTIGDTCVTPDSDHPYRLALPPMVDVPAFTKRNLRNTFEGLGKVNGAACAIIAFTMEVSPFQMSIGGTAFDCSSAFRGTISVNLADGSVEHGEFDEFVMGAAGPVYPRYEIRRIDEAAWQGGTFDLVF